MGGGQSTQPPTVTTSAGPNNNSGDVVIIPVDGSKQAETAFLWYVHHVHKPENTVHILHCQELSPTSPMLAEHAFRTESWHDLMKKASEEGQGLVSLYEKKLAENNIRGAVHFELGKPGEVVVGNADKHKATMVVMGTRGFGMIRRTILGSVSEYVIHHTKIPVTVVPKETTSWFF